MMRWWKEPRAKHRKQITPTPEYFEIRHDATAKNECNDARDLLRALGGMAMRPTQHLLVIAVVTILAATFRIEQASAQTQVPEGGSEQLYQVLAASSDPYEMKKTLYSPEADHAVLARFLETSDPVLCDLAQQRLQIEALKRRFMKADTDANTRITDEINAQVNLDELIPRLALQALKQRAMHDEPFSDLMKRTFRGHLQDFHDVTLTEHQNVALASLAGLDAEVHFRQSVELMMKPRPANDSMRSSISCGFSSNPEKRDVRLYIKNRSKKTLHNCIVVLDILSDPTLYAQGEAEAELFAGGMMALLGVDPTNDAILSFLIRVNSTADRGAFVFVPEFDSESTIFVDVDDAKRFATRVRNANVSFSCDEFCLKDQSVRLTSFLRTIQRRMQTPGRGRPSSNPRLRRR